MPDSTKTPLPVVVGIDGSQAAIGAAEWAIDEAVTREVPLRLVAVIPQQAEPAPLDATGAQICQDRTTELSTWLL